MCFYVKIWLNLDSKPSAHLWRDRSFASKTTNFSKILSCSYGRESLNSSSKTACWDLMVFLKDSKLWIGLRPRYGFWTIPSSTAWTTTGIWWSECWIGLRFRFLNKFTIFCPKLVFKLDSPVGRAAAKKDKRATMQINFSTLIRVEPISRQMIGGNGSC